MSYQRAPSGRKLFPIPKGKGPNGRPFCRVCGEEVAPRRRTFCSQKCVDRYLEATDPRKLRRDVRRRDKGICAECGVDTKKIKKEARAIQEERGRKAARAWLKKQGYNPDRSLWDAHHVIPVCEGGGECGLENMQTLCVPCHRIKTAEMHARRAAERREKK